MAWILIAAEQRTKEIGIRKILGASDSLIIVLLSKEFTRLVLVASVIAMPLAYLAMRLWLGGFAYRININNIWSFSWERRLRLWPLPG